MRFKTRIMHRFSSRSGESDDLTECNAVRVDDFAAAVENLCIIRVKPTGRREP